MEHFPFDNGKIRALTLRSVDRVLDPANPVKISAFSKDRPWPLDAGHRVFGIIERFCYEKATHKGLDYGKDQLGPFNTHPRIVRVVDSSGAFSWFQGVPAGHEMLWCNGFCR